MRRHISKVATLVVALGWLSASGLATGQTPKIPRVGVLGPEDGTTWVRQGLRAGLAELGYVEGKTIHIEYRWAHGQFDRLPELAAELVRLDVDVIVAGVTAASLAAKAATGAIPIVMAGVADPVAVGLVASLGRPGGNVTGTSAMAAEIVGKQLELLKDTDPKLVRASVLWNPANAAFQTLQVREAEAAGLTSGIELRFHEARSPAELEAALAAAQADGTRALLVLADPVFTRHRDLIAELVIKYRLLAVSGINEFAKAGGPMAYGPNYHDASRRAAVYVDRILKGAKPADLPVEQSSRFELAVNLKTAKALGITIPQSILLRADEVIE